MKQTNDMPIATLEVLNEVNALRKQIAEIISGRDFREISAEEENRVYDLETKIYRLQHEDYIWFDQKFIENGRYGIKDVFGKVIVPAAFDGYIELFHYEFRRSAIPMKLNGKAVLVKTDGSGEIIPNTKYDTILYVPYSPYYRMYKNNRLGFLSADGQVVLNCICDECGEACNGVIPFKSDGKYGLLYFSGEVIPATFDEIEAPEPGEAFKVRIGDEWGYIKEDMSFTTDEDEAYWGCPDC